MNQLKVLNAHSAPVYDVAISPDNKTIVSGGADNTLKVWNIATNKFINLDNSSAFIKTLSYNHNGTFFSASWLCFCCLC